jgi:hypothetical protein
MELASDGLDTVYGIVANWNYCKNLCFAFSRLSGTSGDLNYEPSVISTLIVCSKMSRLLHEIREVNSY